MKRRVAACCYMRIFFPLKRCCSIFGKSCHIYQREFFHRVRVFGILSHSEYPYTHTYTLHTSIQAYKNTYKDLQTCICYLYTIHAREFWNGIFLKMPTDQRKEKRKKQKGNVLLCQGVVVLVFVLVLFTSLFFSQEEKAANQTFFLYKEQKSKSIHDSWDDNGCEEMDKMGNLRLFLTVSILPFLQHFFSFLSFFSIELSIEHLNIELFHLHSTFYMQ